MKIGWIGFHMEGFPALRTLLEDGVEIEALITLKPHLRDRLSGAIGYEDLCRKHGVPLYEIAHINDEDSIALLRRLSLDYAFLIGWSQIVGSEALASVKKGMIGAHASLLPHNRGSAPVNWSIIKGEKMAGNSLIWLSEGLDTGEIIDQVEIPVSKYDTCKSIYEKVAESNLAMIRRLLPRLLGGERPGRPQQHTDEPPLTLRRPDDGKINWEKHASEVYDFVRALTRPYPGAFSYLLGRRWLVWDCALLPGKGCGGHRAGEIIGPVFSPCREACGQAVACGEGAIVVLELEGEGGDILNGQRLSDMPWKGKVWSNG